MSEIRTSTARKPASINSALTAAKSNVVQQAKLMDSAGTAWHAVKYGNLEMITRLFPSQCNVYSKGPVGENVFHIAMLLNTPSTLAIAKYLVKLYGKTLVNTPYQERKSETDPPGQYEGETALHIAIVNHDFDMVKFLVQNGADVRARAYGSFFQPGSAVYYGEYPLSFAACTGQKDIVSYLKRHGARVNHDRDQWGNTALHMCVYHDQPDMFDHLVEYCGASEHVQNNRSQTPLSLAASLGKVEMLQHIYNKRRRVAWAYGPVTSYSLALREIDTVQNPGEYVPSAIETSVRKGHLELLGDPLVQTLLQTKWQRFGKTTFLLQVSAYLVWVVSQTFLVWLLSDPVLWNRRARLAMEVLGVVLGGLFYGTELLDFAQWTVGVYRRRKLMKAASKYRPPLYPIPGERLETVNTQKSNFLTRLIANNRQQPVAEAWEQQPAAEAAAVAAGGAITAASLSLACGAAAAGNTGGGEGGGAEAASVDVSPLAAGHPTYLRHHRAGRHQASITGCGVGGGGRRYSQQQYDDEEVEAALGTTMCSTSAGLLGGMAAAAAAAAAPYSAAAAASLTAAGQCGLGPLSEQDDDYGNVSDWQGQSTRGLRGNGGAGSGSGAGPVGEGLETPFTAATATAHFSGAAAAPPPTPTEIDPLGGAGGSNSSAGAGMGGLQQLYQQLATGTSGGAGGGPSVAASLASLQQQVAALQQMRVAANMAAAAATGSAGASGTATSIPGGGGVGSSFTAPLASAGGSGLSAVLAGSAGGLAGGAYQGLMSGSGGGLGMGIGGVGGSLGQIPPVGSLSALGAMAGMGLLPEPVDFVSVGLGPGPVGLPGGLMSGSKPSFPAGGQGQAKVTTMLRPPDAAPLPGQEARDGPPARVSNPSLTGLTRVPSLGGSVGEGGEIRNRMRGGGGDNVGGTAMPRAATRRQVTNVAGGSAGELEHADTQGAQGAWDEEPQPDRTPAALRHLKTLLHSYRGYVKRMVRDPIQFMHLFHNCATLVHFITWAVCYGGVGGDGPTTSKSSSGGGAGGLAYNIRLLEFDDVVVSMMVLSGWISLLYYSRGHQSLGQLMVLVERCLVEVVKFTALFFVANVAFTLALYTCAKGTTTAVIGTDHENPSWVAPAFDPMSNIGYGMIQMVRFLYGEADYGALAVVPNHRVKTAFATMYFLLYVALVLLLLGNLLVAMVLRVCSGPGWASAEKQWRLRWAQYVLRVEARMPISVQQRFRLGEVSYDPVLQTRVYNHVFEVLEERREKEEDREAQIKALDAVMEKIRSAGANKREAKRG